MEKMVKIDSLQKLVECLRYFDTSTPRTITERVGRLDDYAKKLMVNAKNYYLEKEGKIVGFVSFYTNKGDTAYLSNIAVIEAMKGRGAGSRILADALNISKRAGMKRMRLEVDKQNTAAVRFYQKNGFTIEKVTGKNSFFMIKKIEEG